VLLINDQQVKESINIKNAYPILKNAYKACVKGEMYMGGRIFLPIRGSENSIQCLVANCTNVPYCGEKYSSSFPGNRAKGLPSGVSKIYLYSAETGEVLAVIDATYLTGIKTGVGAGIATDLMARKNATRLGIVGTGLQAYYQVMAIQEIRELSELRIFDVFDKLVDDFARAIRKDQNRPYEIIKASSADECIAGSEMISTCTTSHTPVFDGKVIQPGTHINAIGSFTPYMQEIDEETVTRTDKIITEHTEDLWKSAGDILIPYNKGMITKEKVRGSVGEVLVGKIPGRENNHEITLYESVGSCVLDLSLAIEIYEQYSKQ
jgi:ornithine cyclodeaminase